MKKSLMSIILAVVTAISISTTTAFAAEPIEKTSNTVLVEGTVEAITTLDIDVPVKVTFLIDADRNFQSADFEVVNNAPVPITVTATSIKAQSATAAKVVEENVHTDTEWDNLNKTETQSQIALGLQVKGKTEDLTEAPTAQTKWFGAESGDSNIQLGVIKSAYNTNASPRMQLAFDAKYGKAWVQETTLNYDLILTFSIN